jgi:glycosyltransferase involved in cell wall biosynthesis
VKPTQPLISVVIPTHNRATLLPGALNSIQQQTYKNWEAIVVDDGSKDNTQQVVDALARDDRRIRFIRQYKNRGAQVARNAGIRAARGEWIAFLDSDDVFLPNSLEVRLETLQKQNLFVVHSECNSIERDGSMKAYGIPPIAGRVHQRLLAGPGPLLQTLMVAKDALERIGYLDEKIVAFQEWETVIRLAKYYPFGFVASPTCIYDCRQSDSMSRNDLLGAKGYEQIFHKHFIAILSGPGPGALAHHYQTAAAWYERGGDQAAVRRCQLMARVFSCLDPKIVLRKFSKALHSTRS